MAVQVRSLATDMIAVASTALKQLVDSQEGDGCDPEELWARLAVARDNLDDWEAYARRSIREAA